jgi:hypothetical protein
MRRALSVFIGLVLLSSAAAAEQFYKWKDENGVWHYSAKAPKDQAVDKLSVRSAGTRAEPAEEAEDEDADKAKADATQSPNCLAARKNLQILNTSTEVAKDIDGDGEPETLTLEQHREEIELAERQQAAFCKPDPAPAEEEGTE